MYQQINLYQPIFRKQRQIFSAVTMAQALGIVAVALLADLRLRPRQRPVGSKPSVVQLEGREKAMTTQLMRIDPALGANRRAELDAELRRLNATLVDQQRLIDVLRERRSGGPKAFPAFSKRWHANARRSCG